MRSRPRVAEHDLGVVVWAYSLRCNRVERAACLSTHPSPGKERLFLDAKHKRWVLEAVNEFTEETGIEVDVRAISWSLDELLVAARSRLPARRVDARRRGAGRSGSPGDDGAAHHRIETWEHRDDVAPQVFELGTYQGKVVGLPWRGSRWARCRTGPTFSPKRASIPSARRRLGRSSSSTAEGSCAATPTALSSATGLTLATSVGNRPFGFGCLTMQTGIDVFGDRDHSLTDPRIARAVEVLTANSSTATASTIPVFSASSPRAPRPWAQVLGGALVRLLEDFVELGGNEQDLRFAVYPHPEEPWLR